MMNGTIENTLSFTASGERRKESNLWLLFLRKALL
jgi:hypothetical protein